AKVAGIPLKIVDVSPSAQIPFVDEALSKSKTVSYSTIPVYMAYKAMVDDNVGVSVNALGLDELFAGYTIHRRFYSRGRIRFVPRIGRLMPMRPYRWASLRWGRKISFLFANSVPYYAFKFVKGSNVDFMDLYKKNIESNDLWTVIHKWILWAMISNYANLVSRPAVANGIEVVFPYMEKDLMTLTLNYSPRSKYNKGPIRSLMRTHYNFPEELASRGETWDKIGWGGTIDPYLADKEYMSAILPSHDSADDWFTERGLKEYNEMRSTGSVRAFHMALFLKTLELI
ncbi:hypothetical protein KAR91_76260, partial [Candidatus Pacearchaeota archaeon]|nr:hypothetical protein [Candidatus Pacearchaeota archaeon]